MRVKKERKKRKKEKARQDKEWILDFLRAVLTMSRKDTKRVGVGREGKRVCVCVCVCV